MLVANGGKDHSVGGKQVFSYCAYGKAMWADQTAPDKRKIVFFLVAKMIHSLILLVLIFCDAVLLSDIIYYFSVFMITKWKSEYKNVQTW